MKDYDNWKLRSDRDDSPDIDNREATNMTTQEQDKMESLEAALEENEKEMELMEKQREACKIVELRLRAELSAVIGELQEYKMAKVGEQQPPMIVGHGINDPAFYFNQYEYASKETVLIALMNAESMLYRYALIRTAGIQWVLA